MSVNKVILIGNLGADPELRYLPGGQAVCEFRIATTERWTSREGQQKEDTQWHRIVVWGKQGEQCKEYLAKGRQAYVEGRLRTRQWEDPQGQKRYMTEIVAMRVQFLGGRGGAGQGASAGAGGASGGGSGSYGQAGGRDSGGGPPDDFGPPADGGGGDDEIPF
jgi:single-strand DNA-binding protein